jgi:hypothetical protein
VRSGASDRSPWEWLGHFGLAYQLRQLGDIRSNPARSDAFNLDDAKSGVRVFAYV